MTQWLNDSLTESSISRSDKTVSKVWGFRLTKVKLSHLVSTWGPPTLHWEILCPALTEIAQWDQADPRWTGAKARLVPVPPSPPLSRTLPDTRPRCVDPFKKMDLANMEKNANLRTEWRIFAPCPGTRNTRQTCAGPTTVWASVPTDRDVILFTPWTRWGTLQLNPQPRRRPAALWSSSRCSGGTTWLPATPLTSPTPSPRPRSPPCGPQWRSWTNISTWAQQSTTGNSPHPTIPPAAAPSAPTLSLFLRPLHPENLSVTPQLTPLTTCDCQSSADLLNSTL